MQKQSFISHRRPSGLSVSDNSDSVIHWESLSPLLTLGQAFLLTVLLRFAPSGKILWSLLSVSIDSDPIFLSQRALAVRGFLEHQSVSNGFCSNTNTSSWLEIVKHCFWLETAKQIMMTSTATLGTTLLFSCASYMSKLAVQALVSPGNNSRHLLHVSLLKYVVTSPNKLKLIEINRE